MPTTSTPVAMGSSVPAWPTLRVPARRRMRATTSCDVQSGGLVHHDKPDDGSATRRRHRRHPAVARRRRLRVVTCGALGTGRPRPRRPRPGATATVASSRSSGLLERLDEARGSLRDRVEDELEARREPDPELASDERAKPAARRGERGGGVGARRVVAVDGVEDRRVLKVARHPDVRHGDETQPGVLDLRLERVGDDPLDRPRDPEGAR